MEEGLCNQDLAVRRDTDSGRDEGTNRDITGADGSLLINTKLRNAGTASEVSQGQIILIGMWRRQFKVWWCVCGRK